MLRTYTLNNQCLIKIISSYSTSITIVQYLQEIHMNGSFECLI